MQINGANNNQLGGFIEGIPPVNPHRRRTSQDPEAGASLETDYHTLISQALQPARSQSETVQRAGELLASGQLEGRQAARGAAENILKLGI